MFILLYYRENNVILVNPGVCDKLVSTNTDNMLQSYQDDPDQIKSECSSSSLLIPIPPPPPPPSLPPSLLPGVCDKLVSANTDNMLQSYRDDPDQTKRK